MVTWILYRKKKNLKEVATISHENKFIYRIWKPGLFNIRPKGIKLSLILPWFVYTYLPLFTARVFRMYLVYDQEKLIHYSFLFGKSYKFPFIQKNDIFLGPIWTSDEYRRRGISFNIAEEIIHSPEDKVDYFWWMCDEKNIGSRKLAEKLGFLEYGKVKRHISSIWRLVDEGSHRGV
jgi:hypothetical protein